MSARADAASPASFLYPPVKKEEEEIMSDRYGWEVPVSTKGVPIRSAIGAKEPVAHPKNCRTECPYGYDKAFCFPCMAKLMREYRIIAGLEKDYDDDDEDMCAVPVW